MVLPARPVPITRTVLIMRGSLPQPAPWATVAMARPRALAIRPKHESEPMVGLWCRPIPPAHVASREADLWRDPMRHANAGGWFGDG